MMHFKHDLPNIIKISRKDIYGSWDVYLKYFLMYGGLIEAEPLTTNKGFVEASCFIEPGGTVESLKGVELFVDKKYQTQGFNYPQMVAPPEQLRMAMMNICHELYRCICYTTLYHTIPHYNTLYHTIPHYTTLYHTIQHYTH